MQRDLSELVVEGGGEYVWTVKDNQSSLRAEIEVAFAIEEGKTALPAMNNDLARAETIEKGHGRIEACGDQSDAGVSAMATLGVSVQN